MHRQSPAVPRSARARPSRKAATTLRRKNTKLSVFLRLPVELVAWIFQLLLDSVSEAAYYKTLEILAAVCRSWKHVVDSKPSFRSLISFSRHPSSGTLERLLKSSGNSPLRVCAHGVAAEKNWQQVIPHASRWRSLYFTHHIPSVDNLFNASRALPMLREPSVWVAREKGDAVVRSLASHPISSLRHLTLRGEFDLPAAITSGALVRLYSLELHVYRGTRSLDSAHVVELLERNRDLRSLYLVVEENIPGVVDKSNEHHPILMSVLEHITLRINGRHLDDVLRRLHLAICRTIRTDFPAGDAPFVLSTTTGCAPFTSRAIQLLSKYSGLTLSPPEAFQRDPNVARWSLKPLGVDGESAAHLLIRATTEVHPLGLIGLILEHLPGGTVLHIHDLSGWDAVGAFRLFTLRYLKHLEVNAGSKFWAFLLSQTEGLLPDLHLQCLVIHFTIRTDIVTMLRKLFNDQPVNPSAIIRLKVRSASTILIGRWKAGAKVSRPDGETWAAVKANLGFEEVILRLE